MADSDVFLKIPLADAQAQIQEQLTKAEAILDERPEDSKGTYGEFYREFEKRRVYWVKYTRDLLARVVFTSDMLATEFDGADDIPADSGPSKIDRERLKRQLDALRSIHERLPLYEAPLVRPIGLRTSRVVKSRDVFVVHGRDDAAKSSIMRFLEKLGLNPIVLHEQADRGRTVIEKFEDHSTTAGFAVILLTPDDHGGLIGQDLMPRARQNVVFELGYFVGKLGRGRVCALKSENVEEPSDLRGILYIPIDNHGAWKLGLARELKGAGIDVDLNKAI